MATVRKTITLTGQQDDWIKAQVEGGDYTNDNEYIRELIRREQERGAKIEAVRAALIEGEESGRPERFDAGTFKRQLRHAHGLSRHVSKLNRPLWSG
jgi:antitoxin ParD1/3/4